MAEVREVERHDEATVRGILASIDRSEHVDVEYRVVDGELVTRPVTMADVPAWLPGDGPYSLGELTAFACSALRRGGVLLVAEIGRATAGTAIIVPQFEPPMAWVSLLHVSRLARRRGVAAALHERMVALAREAGATSLYVSAVPTGSAVGFYRSRGFRLARPVHPELFAVEPDDIHLRLDLAVSSDGRGATG
jgi:GNAT superfamily N-acetyltransferase